MTSDAPTHLEKLLAPMTADAAKAVASSPELFHAQQTEIILRGVSRGMEYLSTVPKLFRARHWPQHEDAIAFVTAALCYYRWGQVSDPRAFDTGFRWPPLPAFDHRWQKLHRLVRPTARQIVATLELHELAPKGVGVKFTPFDDDEPLIILP